MSDVKHTPGPWEIEKSEASSTGSVHYAVKTSYKPPEHDWSPRFIVFMCGGLGDFHPARPMNDYRSDPQIEADVRLIAAAPDLLAAAQYALRVGYRADDCGDHCHSDCYWCQLRAAVAHAEGK